MAKRRRLSRKQERLIFARLHEEAGRRQQNIPPRITREQDPKFQQVLNFLSSGKSTDPRIQAIKDKLRGQANQPRKGFSFNPGQSGKGHKFVPIAGQEETRLVRGKMVKQPLKVPVASGEMEPEFVNNWTPSPKQKASLWNRANRFADRIRRNQIAQAINKVGERKFKARASEYDRALLRRAEGNYKFHGVEDEVPKHSGVVKYYGMKGYHLVPKLEITSYKNKPQYDPHRVVYPKESRRLFRQEAERSFSGFKKRIVAETNAEGRKVKTFTGEYVPKHEVRPAMSRIQESGSRGKILTKPHGPQLKPQAVTEGKKSDKPVQKLDSNTFSPFRRISEGRIRGIDSDIVALRRRGNAFIIDEHTGRPVSPPRYSKPLSGDVGKQWGSWKPNTVFDRMKWDSPYTTEKEREDIYKRITQEANMNPLRRQLQEAEYQTYGNRKTPTSHERVLQALKTASAQRKTERGKILHHRLTQSGAKIRGLQKEKKQLAVKIEKYQNISKKRRREQTFAQRMKRLLL